MAETVVLTKEEVMEALKDVYDPEIPVNVVDLGLVYDCKVDDGDVQVKMTLTFAGCGMGPYIAQQAEWRIAEIAGRGRGRGGRDGVRPALDARYDLRRGQGDAGPRLTGARIPQRLDHPERTPPSASASYLAARRER